MADLLDLGEKNVQRLLDNFWNLPRKDAEGKYIPGAPLPKQDILRDTIDHHAKKHLQVLQTYNCYGSIRSGKTDGIIAKLCEGAFKYPGTRTLVMRRTIDELHNSVIQSVEAFFERLGMVEGKGGDYRIRRGDSPRIWLPNGSVFIFMSWEKSDKTKEGRADTLSGSEFAQAWLEEANEAPLKLFETAKGRMSQTDAMPYRLLVGSHNPPSEEHWLYTEFYVDDPGPNHYNIHFPLEDNRPNLGDEYVDGVINDYKHSPTLFKKLYLGQYCHTVDGTAIYKNSFRRRVHVAAEPLKWDPNQKMVGVWDFGFVHPCLLVLQDDDRTGQIKVLMGKLGEREMIEKFGSRMKSLLHRRFPGAKWRWIADIAGKRRTANAAKSELDILEGVLGGRCETMYSKIQYGVSIVSQELSRILPKGAEGVNGSVPALIFDPSVTEMIDALEHGYVNDPDAKRDEIKPKQDAKYEHFADCLRYGVQKLRKLGPSTMPVELQRKNWRSVTDRHFVEGTSFTDLMEEGHGSDFASYGFGRKK